VSVFPEPARPPDRRPVEPVPDPPRPLRTRRPRTVGGAIYLLVAGACLVGLVAVAGGSWRSGLAWMGLALVAGSVCRLVLSDDNAGMLRVRRKSVDVVLMVLLGVALVVLSVAVPDAGPLS
jgi:O-antigen ligase